MNAHPNFIRRAALGLFAAAALAGCASSPPSTPPDIAQRIESARTRADHESLVTYYNQEAAKARESAARHRKMGQLYQTGMYGGGRGGASSAMGSHCSALAQGFDNAASMYDSMATTHRQLAEQARP